MELTGMSKYQQENLKMSNEWYSKAKGRAKVTLILPVLVWGTSLSDMFAL